MSTDFDVIVLGSGIAGSTLALALKNAGLSTLCIERKSHPRFVIGESTIPTTTMLFTQLSVAYGIPELAQIFSYLGLRESGCAAWPKQGFWFSGHKPGETVPPERQLFFDTFILPIGPDVHMLRSDVDAFLVSAFPKYGVPYEDNTDVVAFSTTPSGVSLTLRGPQGTRDVTARFVVDATGHTSFLANRFGLRDEVPRLRTNTRSIFAHFTGVRPLDDLFDGHDPSFLFRRDAGTMHHCFRGGWVWVIPFDNGVTSVGFELDRDLYPLDPKIPPEEEIATLLERYPTMAAHLGAAKPIRPIIRADRIQFTSSTILGNGFILTPHAGAFIEPLYSTGMLLTALFISRFVPAAQKAKASGDWSSEQFKPIEDIFFQEVAQIDRIVNGSIQSFRTFDLFKQVWRLWITGTMAHNANVWLVGRAPMRPIFYGAGIDGFRQHVDKVHRLVCESRSEQEDLALAAHIFEESNVWWAKLAEPTAWVLDTWAPNSKTATGVHCNKGMDAASEWMAKHLQQPETAHPDMSFANVGPWVDRVGQTHHNHLTRYAQSRAEGTDFHRAYERILNQHNPARFDYYKAVGLPSPRGA